MSTSAFEQVTSSLTVMAILGLAGPRHFPGSPLWEVENYRTQARIRMSTPAVIPRALGGILG